MLTALKLASGLLISSKKRENHIEQKFSIVGNNENVQILSWILPFLT